MGEGRERYSIRGKYLAGLTSLREEGGITPFFLFREGVLNLNYATSIGVDDIELKK